MGRLDKLKIYIQTMLLVMLVILLSSCVKQEITFSAEVESVTKNSITVKPINYDKFDKASVDLRNVKYNFKLSEGQIVDVTILPEIKESYPVQTTGVKLELVKDVKPEIADYFPIRQNVRYIYEGTGNEFAEYSAFVDYTSANRMQQMIENGGTSLVRVYEMKDGKLIRTLSRGEVYYRENMLDQHETDEVLLMEPLKKGTSWTLSDGSERTITGTSTEITIPMGTYSAIEVTTEGKDGNNIDYYVKNLGLVKTIFKYGEMEVSSSLKAVEENADRIQSVNFYYPDVQSDKIYYIKKDITYHTNDRTGKLLEDSYKQAAKETYGVAMPTGAAIKSLTLDQDNKVRLDLNQSFVTEMNAGSDYESMILQCIADTFGQYFNSKELILTIEGKPYESGHILMKEGQSIPVRYEGVTEKKE